MSMTVSEAVLSRRSIRQFRAEPVALETIREVLEKARWAPSGCNFQPWECTVLTGEPLRTLQEILLASPVDDPLEYRCDAPAFHPEYKSRMRELGHCMYQAVGIERDDRAARDDFARQNIVSFGAPVLLLSHFPKFMGPPQWSDVGMWLQTVMLLLRDAGLHSCPQEYMGLYGRTIKAHLGLGEDTLLFCGIAIGHADESAPVNQFDRDRVPLDEQATFLGF